MLVRGVQVTLQGVPAFTIKNMEVVAPESASLVMAHTVSSPAPKRDLLMHHSGAQRKKNETD